MKFQFQFHSTRDDYWPVRGTGVTEIEPWARRETMAYWKWRSVRNGEFAKMEREGGRSNSHSCCSLYNFKLPIFLVFIQLMQLQSQNHYVEETPFASMLIPKQHSFLWWSREWDYSGIFRKHLICKRCLECCWVLAWTFVACALAETATGVFCVDIFSPYFFFETITQENFLAATWQRRFIVAHSFSLPLSVFGSWFHLLISRD